MKKINLALILLAYLFLGNSQVYAQNTFVIVQQPPIPGYYYPVAFSINDSKLQKWIADNEKRRQIKRIERKKMLQAQRKRLKELKEKYRSNK